jgi:hypothetical protein
VIDRNSILSSASTGKGFTVAKIQKNGQKKERKSGFF